MKQRMTGDMLRHFKSLAATTRLMDVDGEQYRRLTECIECLEMYDVGYLASLNINFVSPLAGRVLASRYTSA